MGRCMIHSSLYDGRTYMGPHGVPLDELGHRRLAGGQRVMEGLDAPAPVEAQPEPVRVNVGGAAPLTEPLERKGKVRLLGAVHSQNLAHGSTVKRACT
jgi:hypothetical protein